MKVRHHKFKDLLNFHCFSVNCAAFVVMASICSQRIEISCGCVTSLGFLIFVTYLTITSPAFRPMGVTFAIIFFLMCVISLCSACFRGRYEANLPAFRPMHEVLSSDAIDRLHTFKFTDTNTTNTQCDPTNPMHSESNDDCPFQVICCICLSEYVTDELILRLPACQHCFHKECIAQWLAKSIKCPICKANVVAPAPSGSPRRLTSGLHNTLQIITTTPNINNSPTNSHIQQQSHSQQGRAVFELTHINPARDSRIQDADVVESPQRINNVTIDDSMA